MKALTIILSLSLLCCTSVKEPKSWELDHIQMTQLSPNSFQHISFLTTKEYGKVQCNGLIVKDGNEALVLDCPVGLEASKELIHWVKKELKCTVIGVVPTHFHEDCVGGLAVFHQAGIPSYASKKTIGISNKNGTNFKRPFYC